MLKDTYENPTDYFGLSDSHLFFHWHALYLLEELEATSSFPTFLKMMEQGEEYYQCLVVG